MPGAASYSLNVFGTKTSKLTTVATAYAVPGAWETGAYSWSVTAYDGAGKALSVSATQQFSVDATPPTVRKVGPATLRAGSTIKATFSERVTGISGRSVKLFFLKGDRRVRVTAKVTSLKGSTVAALDPAGSLKRGDYVLVFVSSRIKDLRGLPLVPTQIGLRRQ